MAFLAQGKARFLCLVAGGMLADREGESGVYWAEEICHGFQGLEGGRGLTEWAHSVPCCETRTSLDSRGAQKRF